MAQFGENPVLHINRPGESPKALVFTGSKAERPMTPAEAKRGRFIKNLKGNFAKLNEALAAFEFFAEICELSLECRADIKKANQAAIAELTARFEKKLAEYDRRSRETG
ncbi:MAG: hypothetical protein A2218_10350 [Elusimicrobia bacterium RIFOXYA2_FULL_53_38]|nr:MAG: hypothetical protein A2218_10350 [Elusimicrobia bacterium RIFOXYA2_FULL_53_38]